MSNPRALSAAERAYFGANEVSGAWLARIDYRDGPLCVTTMSRDWEYDGFTWIGVGGAGSVSAGAESTDMGVHGTTLTLSGVSVDRIADALPESRQRARARTWLALFGDGRLKRVVPHRFGFIDQIVLNASIEQFSITMTIENTAMLLRIPRPRRYNGATQRELYPDDTGLDPIQETATRTIVFPSRAFFQRG